MRVAPKDFVNHRFIFIEGNNLNNRRSFNLELLLAHLHTQTFDFTGHFYLGRLELLANNLILKLLGRDRRQLLLLGLDYFFLRVLYQLALCLIVLDHLYLSLLSGDFLDRHLTICLTFLYQSCGFFLLLVSYIYGLLMQS